MMPRLGSKGLSRSPLLRGGSGPQLAEVLCEPTDTGRSQANLCLQGMSPSAAGFTNCAIFLEGKRRDGIPEHSTKFIP